MNKIKAAWDKSDYEIYDDFLNIQVDGHFLDEILEGLYPDNMYKGLIPTLLFNLEEDIVWNRILPYENQTTICPILMCPDDCDSSCTLIIAEIENLGQSIKWNQMGIDRTKGHEPAFVGSTIDWFDKIKPLEFEINQYMDMIKEFARHFESSKRK